MGEDEEPHYQASPDTVLLMTPRVQKFRRFQLAVWVAFGIIACSLLLVILHRNKTVFVSWIGRRSVAIRNAGIYGELFCALLCCLFSFPVIIGFSALNMLIGFIYGLPEAMIPVFIGTFLGSSILYAAFGKKSWHGWALRKLQNNNSLYLIFSGLSKNPLQATLLLRMSALPFASVNFLCCVMRDGYAQFAAGLSLSMMKGTYNMYLGSLLSDTLQPTSNQILRLTILGVSIAANVAVGVIVGRIIRRTMAEPSVQQQPI